MKTTRRDFVRCGSLAALGLTGFVLANEEASAAAEIGGEKVHDAKRIFVHAFNFKFKQGVPEEEIAELMRDLANSKGKIPVLKELLIGKNVAPKRLQRGFQYGEIAIFEKEEDLKVFDRHPEHRKLVKRILPRMEFGNAMDFVPIGGAGTGIGTEKAGEKKSGFVHAFSFKFKQGVPEEEIAEVMNDLAQSKAKIPVFKEYMVGKNVARMGRGFQYGEIAIFEKKEDLKVYQNHPEHRKIVKRILPKLAFGNAMDFVPIAV